MVAQGSNLRCRVTQLGETIRQALLQLPRSIAGVAFALEVHFPRKEICAEVVFLFKPGKALLVSAS